MIVRRPICGGLVDMSADAEAQLWILVENLERPALLRRQMLGHEILVQQHLRYQRVNRLLSG